MIRSTKSETQDLSVCIASSLQRGSQHSTLNTVFTLITPRSALRSRGRAARSADSIRPLALRRSCVEMCGERGGRGGARVSDITD